jgi:outer membrane protein assembly factor BamE (lipoprotein component of BamABCDE complex)
MKIQIITTFIAATILLVGCATSHKINTISTGMSKEAVIALMGKPVSVSATDGVEYLNYRLSETSDNAFYGITTPYFVRIVDGKVDAFGRMGDFDSTKTPTVRIEKDEDIRVRSDSSVESKPDLYTELKKLKELRDEDIITEEEFEREKKELLERL